MTIISFNVTLDVPPATIAALLDLAKAVAKAIVADGANVIIAEQRMDQPPAEQADAEQTQIVQQPVATPQTLLEMKSKIWTSERITALATMRAIGESWPTCFIRLNKLPGQRIKSEAAVTTKYYELRRAGRLPKVEMAPPPVVRRVGPPLPPAKPVAATPPAHPQDVSYDQARTWAAQRGLVTGHAAMNIEVVNAKRLELGLPRFRLVDKRPAP